MKVVVGKVQPFSDTGSFAGRPGEASARGVAMDRPTARQKQRMNQAVFLDRDGVINRALIMDGKPYPPGSLSELEILPGVADALARLRAAGFRLVVVTNQPDVARGTQSRANVEAMHDWLGARLALDEFRVCYHDDAARCACRKPEPGAILAAAEKKPARFASQFSGGRSLARHRSRTAGGMPDDLR